MFDRNCYTLSADIYPKFSYENKRILIILLIKVIINNSKNNN